MNQQQNSKRPPLAALVYRMGKGCRQYAFGTADALQAWASRHPYRNETLMVLAVKKDGNLSEKCHLPANEAADYVRKIGAQA